MRVVRRLLSLLLAFLVALAGVIALLLFLQSRDQATLEDPPSGDRPAITQTRSTP